MAEANAIKEGFICPICHKDLRSPNNLIAHFQDLHSEEQDILKSIKDLYGKAKKKILKLDDQDLETFRNEITVAEYIIESGEPQDPGQIRNHTDYFKAVRRERLDHRTTETNKLIIRLDRLLRFYGSDRKQQEQKLVAWLDGATVSRCPSCAASFNIARRQHHCRLCGGIMCNSCSFFLSYDIAQTIVAPVHNVDVNNRDESLEKETESLRVCNHCLTMLECRRRIQIEQMKQPIICQLYTHLQTLKTQTQSSVDLYLKMYNSLTAGETTFQLQDTQALRTSIAKKAEAIDILSKKISTLSVPEDTPRAGTLHNSIRRATSNYIKEYLLTLPIPPTVKELEKIKRDRSLRNAHEDFQPVGRREIKKIAVTTGWSPDVVSTDVNDTGDPLMEQMHIVRSYIVQARKAQRFEEVSSLEENLRMLKETYRQQQMLKN